MLLTIIVIAAVSVSVAGNVSRARRRDEFMRLWIQRAIQHRGASAHELVEDMK